MLVNRQIPSLYNGVSQQPATTRLPSQAEVQVNIYGTVVDGIRRRPPAEHVAKLTSSDLSSAYLHTINRDATERYAVVLTDGDIKVYDLATGAAKTVTFPGRASWVASTAYSAAGVTVRPTAPNGFLYKVTTVGTSGSSEPAWPTTLGQTVVSGTATFTCVPDYLKVTDAKEQFACVTVADYTFIVNKSVVVGLEDIGRDQAVDPTTYYWLNRDIHNSGGLIGGAVYNLLRAQQQQYAANFTGFTFKGVKQSFEELPETPLNGDLWEIQGNADDGFATYFVVRQGAVWNETVKPGLKNKIDAVTMPHALVRKADGTFEFSPFSWAPRRVGDEKTNKAPTFVGRTIRDVFFYKNRLGFAVDENVALSRAGDFGNFFRLTVLDLLADEVIDVGASETKVTKLNHAVAFDKTMMVFSDQVQFRLDHAQVLAPGSCSLDVTTQYKTVPGVRPLPLGSDVYFAGEDGDWAKLFEYYVRDDSSASEAGDVTGHVPKFIPAGVSRLAGSTDHDLVMALTDGAIDRVYTYKFYWANENEKAQSSWSYWTFGDTAQVLSIDVIDNYVYLIFKRSDGAYLEKQALETGAKASGLSFQIFLDRRTTVIGTYLPGENKTEFVLPYPVDLAKRATFRIVRGSAFGGASGAIIAVSASNYEWVDSTHVKVVGNFGAGACFVGHQYASRYTFSAQFMKNPQDVAITSGVLVLNSYVVNFKDTAYFRVEVAPYGVGPDIETIIPSRISEFDGKTIGDAHLIIGTPVFSTGDFRIDVFGDSTVATVSLVNDSPYASTFTQAEWEGNWNNRSRTI